MFGAYSPSSGSPARSPPDAASELQFREATVASPPAEPAADVAFTDAKHTEPSPQFRSDSAHRENDDETSLQFRPPASGGDHDGEGDDRAIQFKQASTEEAEKGEGIQFRQPRGNDDNDDDDERAEDSELRFRSAGEESSSVVLVKTTTNDPTSKKRQREADDESSVELVKKPRTDFTARDAQVDTSLPVRVTDDEKEIADAIAGEFEGGQDGDGKKAVVMDNEEVSNPEQNDTGDASARPDPEGRAKVLSGGEIDDAFVGTFGENEQEDEPEDVALPTERDTGDESAAKDRAADDIAKDPSVGKSRDAKDGKDKPEGVEQMGTAPELDETAPVGKETPQRKSEERTEGTTQGSGNDQLKIDSRPVIEKEKANRVKEGAVLTDKKGQQNVDGKNAKNAKETSGEKKEPEGEKKSSPKKPVDNSKHGKSEQHPDYVDSDEEDAPLDLLAISKYEHGEVAKLTPIQQRRYEQYRRSDLKNPKVKKVLVSYNPSLQKASDLYVIAVKGLAKLFVGDVVESALDVKKQMGDKGALQPKHLREAYRRLRKAGVVPSTTDKSTAFS